jgi:sterol desaturase/sphingolipid hydroxylase (fatty acid hydroxylase superfamily)
MPVELPSWAATFKPVLTVVLMAVFWTWESLFPLVQGREHRWRHAGRNLTIAVFNTVVLSLVFGAATVLVTGWAAENHFGLLNRSGIPWPWRLPIAILLLDGWLYIWHRLNHRLSFLWRFHRMHHADGEMDVTTATRFHIGEHLGAAVLRLGVLPLLGVVVLEVVVFESLVVAVTMFHHANLSLGWLDPYLRCVVVTPRMHQVHHSRLHAEMNANYSTLFPIWDRCLLTYQMRPGTEPIPLGLNEFSDPRWQTVRGMLFTPLADNRQEPSMEQRPSTEQARVDSDRDFRE